MDAATQIFYSLGVAYGSLIAFASYNPIKSECNRDAIHVCLVNCGVSIYASVVVFCFIGFQAEEKMQECLGQQLQQRTGNLYEPRKDFVQKHCFLAMFSECRQTRKKFILSLNFNVQSF
jgi:hypothetical protein